MTHSPSQQVKVVRPDREVPTRQGLPYFVGISGATAGAKGISMSHARPPMRAADLFAALLAVGTAMGAQAHGDHGHPKKPPAKSYEKAPQQPPRLDDYVIRLAQMATFYDAPGEFGHMMIGKDHGFERLSFIITETRPGGGPPLHTHETEEAHVLLSGTATYVVEDPVAKQRKTFTVRGPYVVRIPAGHAHTFINAGTRSFNLTAAFPDSRLTYQEVGPNPLVKRPAPATAQKQ